jgi:hypothetical protein
MTILTQKLWTGIRVGRSPVVTGDAGYRHVLQGIVAAFVASGHWAVRGSCDGISVNNAGTNLWVDRDDLVPEATGVAHSWVVLRNAAIGPTWDLCIDLNSASGAYYLTAAVAVGGYAADGTLTVRPTATDEVIIANATEGHWSNYSSGYALSAWVLTAADGTGTRVMIFNNSSRASSAFWLFDRLANAPSWLTVPWIACVPLNRGSFQGICMPRLRSSEVWVAYKNITEDYTPQMATGLDGTLIRVVVTSMANDELAGTGRRGQSYDRWGAIPLFPVYLISAGPAHPGYLGALSDAWWGPEQFENEWITGGCGIQRPPTTLPSDRSDAGLASIGGWVIATDGSV